MIKRGALCDKKDTDRGEYNNRGWVGYNGDGLELSCNSEYVRKVYF